MTLPVISLSTDILSGVTFDVSRDWDPNGLPIFEVTSIEPLPQYLYLKTILHPSGTPLSIDYVSPNGSSRATFVSLIQNSGYYMHDFTAYKPSGYYSHDFTLDYDWGNTYYQLGYYIEIQNSFGQPVYPPQFAELTGYYLSVAPKPKAMYTNVVSQISGSLDSQRLLLDLKYTNYSRQTVYDIANKELSDPAPYLVTISGVDGYLTISGTDLGTVPFNADNYFYSGLSGIRLNLLFNDGNISGMTEEANVFDYDVRLFNIDQLGVPSPYLGFSTKPFRIDSETFDQGGFTNYSLIRQDDALTLIRPDTVKKKRFSVGIEDLGLIKTSYASTGSFVSDYYTLDNPIYTFSLKVDEWIPSIPQVDPYSIVTYWIELGNKEWIRISPVTRSDELDTDGAVVPKILVLDKLNEGVISNAIKEILPEVPVYSFRLRIDMNMSFLTSDLFISPEVREYECNITDKNNTF